jgi:hypothetical protein
MENKMNNAIQNALNTLRDAGYCVVAFTPQELNGADPEYVESRLTEYGWDTIDFLNGEYNE